MTELLEQAIEQLKGLDADRQNADSFAAPKANAAIIMEELEDEAKWDNRFANSQDLLADLAAEAMAEYNAGETKGLDLK